MRTLLSTMVVYFLICAVAWAQGGATAQIHGTVQDASGAAVPGAEVKATQTETGVIRTVTSEADGSYILSNLPLGPYRLEVSKEGFNKFVQEGIVLQVNSGPQIDPTLKVGAVSEQVVVQANVSQVETRSAGVGTVVETQRIIDLPLNGRQPTDLITLSGAAVQIFTYSSGDMNMGVGISVAGGNGAGVQYNLDGAQHLDFFSGTGNALPFPDALQEFKLSTSSQDASTTGKSAAVVNAVTKSGTNAFHGDAFEFIRNYDLNARDFFATKSDGLKRNQFGGVLGGPIKKDKLFFFLGEQSTFVRQVPVVTQTFVPTPQMLGGDFSTFASPQCQGHQVTLKAPATSPYSFVNNQISPAALSPAALKISALLPSALNSCGLYLTGIPLSEDNYEGVSRVDYQLSDKQSLFARYLMEKDIEPVPYTLAPNNILTSTGSGDNQLYNSVTLGDTFLLSSSEVNSLRLSFNRMSAFDPGANPFGPAAVGINMYTYLPNFMPLSVSGAFSLSSFNYNSFTHTTSFGANDDFTIIRGSHQITFGGFFTRMIEWHLAHSFDGGQFTIGATTGLGLSDFLLGQVSQLRQATATQLNMNQNFFSLYATDTWKITPKLTLTYGVNYEPFFSVGFPQKDTFNFNLGSFYAGQRSTVIPTAPPGFTFPGDPGFPGSSGVDSRWGYFNPRVGLAWDPFGDGKTAIRIGGGIAQDFTPLAIWENNESAFPFRANVIVTNVSLDNPYPNGDPFPYSYNPAHPAYPSPAAIPCLASTCPPAFLPIPSNFQTDKQFSWNFGVQRQVTQGWFVSGTYLGTHIVHLLNAVELNPAIFVPGNCVAGQHGLTAPGACTQSSNITQRRVLNLANPGMSPLGDVTEYDDGGTQGYNGLLLTTAWRLGRQLNLNSNYTWSHCIGLPIPSLNSALNPGANYINQGYGQNVGPANRDLDVGNCVQDRRQVANITLVYLTPQFTNNLARVLGSGWTFASTIVLRSGAPLTALTSTVTDPATGFGGTAATQRPNVLLTDTSSITRGQPCSTATFCESWLNPAAFAAPALGTFGNEGVGSILGPGFWQWDQAISREFRIREGQTLIARFEMFNVTNSFRPGNPGLTVGTSAFGVITADATPPSATTAPYRVLQFAMKYVF
jgi:hypothetical protein